MNIPLILSVCALLTALYGVYATKNKGKTSWFSKFLQVSKLITMILLLMHLATWCVVLVKVTPTSEVENLRILTEYTSDIVSSVMPYFTLTCVERVTNSDLLNKITTVLKKG